MNNLFLPDLYLITDRHQTLGRPLLEVVKMAVDAGVRAVQLRERDLSDRDLLRLAEKLKVILNPAGALFFINDRIDICLAVDADGVHLRSDHIPISVARELLGANRLIGVSCHGIEQVVDSKDQGADYVVLGPIYDTPSKRAYGPPLGPEIITRASQLSALPIYAIGGIQIERVKEVSEAGASGVAVVSSILNVKDVQTAVTKMISALALRGLPGFAIDRIASR